MMERIVEKNRLTWNNSEVVQLGYARFTKIPNLETLICEEVFVDPQFRGKGTGGKLMKDFVNFAIENNQMIYPLCSFAQKYLLHHPELAGMDMSEQISATKIEKLVNRKED
jgi:predicted GNAT family acetyltransferase